MTRSQAQRLRDHVAQALRAEFKGFDDPLEVTIGSTRFDSRSVTIKVTLSEPGATEAQATEAFNSVCHLYGLKPDDLGKVFTAGGSMYKVVAIMTRRPKVPVLLERADGRRFKTTPEFVLRLLHPELLCPNCHRYTGCRCRDSEKAMARMRYAESLKRTETVQNAIAAARQGVQGKE